MNFGSLLAVHKAFNKARPSLWKVKTISSVRPIRLYSEIRIHKIRNMSVREQIQKEGKVDVQLPETEKVPVLKARKDGSYKRPWVNMEHFVRKPGAEGTENEDEEIDLDEEHQVGCDSRLSMVANDDLLVPKYPNPPESKLYGSVVPRSDMLDLFRSMMNPQRLVKMEQVIQSRCSSVTILMENLSDAHNGAACVRTADGHGIQHVYAVETLVDFTYSSNVAKSAQKWVSIHRYDYGLHAADALKAQGYSLFAACVDEDHSLPIDEVDLSKFSKICVMFGNETRGLSKGLRDVADVKVHLPMMGFIQSYNLSISCALFLYHLKRAGKIVPDLSQEEIIRLYYEWIVKATRHGSQIRKASGFDYPNKINKDGVAASTC